VSSELPQMLSDDEFERRLEEREKAMRALRTENDRWDNSGSVLQKFKLSDGLPESTIEQNFPRIAQKLPVLWPSEACAVYLSSLLVNTRENRQGFPPEVVDDLLMLHAMNDMLVRSSAASLRKPPVSAAPVKRPPHF
jgi:hypothetical protein